MKEVILLFGLTFAILISITILHKVRLGILAREVRTWKQL